MKVLLSIKPEFANKIFDGTKQFEFRRVMFKRSVKTVVVYASSPTQRVIGEFEIERVLSADLDSLWAETQEHAGIGKDYFYEYFGDKETGFAIKIKAPRKYQTPQCLRTHYNLRPPQSFLYLSEAL